MVHNCSLSKQNSLRLLYVYTVGVFVVGLSRWIAGSKGMNFYFHVVVFFFYSFIIFK